VIYIDGNHDYEVAHKDWEVCSQSVGPGGVIVLDDADLDAAAAAGAWGSFLHQGQFCMTTGRRIPTGIVHINEQTVDDEPNVPFGGIFDSGTGTRFGGSANLEAFTETRWVTVQGDIAPYPF